MIYEISYVDWDTPLEVGRDEYERIRSIAHRDGGTITEHEFESPRWNGRKRERTDAINR